MSTCSYEARKYGIHSAMPISQAYKLCPDATFLVPKPDIQSYDEAAVIAMRIKDEVKKQEGITCSVGVASNKIIAKIASKVKKPDGLTVVRPEDVQEFMFPLNVSKIPGMGEKTTEALKLMEINKVEELANCDIQRLSERFGKIGLWLKQVANGQDQSEVKEWDAAVKSISRSKTFGEDTNDPIKIAGYMELLVESVHRALTKDCFLFKVVNLVVRYDDFSTYTRFKIVSVWTADIFVIKRTAMLLLAEFLGRQKIRLVGVGVSRL